MLATTANFDGPNHCWRLSHGVGGSIQMTPTSPNIVERDSCNAEISMDTSKERASGVHA